MPTIHRGSNYRIAIYPGDHAPPHFHVVMRDGTEAQVAISNLEVIVSGIATHVLSDALEWARENNEVLQAKWAQYQLAR